MVGATFCVASFIVFRGFQSTLPWWERPIEEAKVLKIIEVSIHAPVVGATNDHGICPLTLNVSIHAPVVGATAIILDYPTYDKCFNPRSRGGSDK